SVVFLDYDVLTATGYSLIQNAHNVQLKGYEAMQRGLGGFPHEQLHQEAIWFSNKNATSAYSCIIFQLPTHFKNQHGYTISKLNHAYPLWGEPFNGIVVQTNGGTSVMNVNNSPLSLSA
ncbi:hypothetical protein, partial [Moorena sp. SIO3B2]|uniref:hypothetical protein n=1 Tax=Moorena sp. SIO3B2 TaxID=2607827 RepID=UPI00257B1F76